MANNDLYLGKINQWLDIIIQSRDGYFPVEVKILQGNQIKVFVDADMGASINELAQINRALRKQIEEDGFFPDGDYSLEVSSPGLDEPLKQLRQYKKNIGREVEVLLTNGQKKKGTLTDVADDAITLAYKPKNNKGKKVKEDNLNREPEQITFKEIKTTKVCIAF